MLSTLLSDQLNASEKKEILETKFQLAMSKTIEKEVGRMCNLSDVIEETGRIEGRIEGRILAAYELGLSENEIVSRFLIPKETVRAIIEGINEG